MAGAERCMVDGRVLGIVDGRVLGLVEGLLGRVVLGSVTGFPGLFPGGAMGWPGLCG